MRAGAFSSLCVLIIGCLFCLCMLLRPDLPICSGAGCMIYAEMEFFGLSFYYWGTILFLALLLNIGRSWFPVFSYIALALDIPMLVWQTLFGSCSNCLIVSALLVLNACLARRASAQRAGGQSRNVRLLVAAAIFLLAFNGINILKDSIAPWALNQNADARGSLYFAPSCGPCREHLRALQVRGELNTVMLIPVARSEQDKKVIHAMSQADHRDGAMLELLEQKFTASIGMVDRLVLEIRLAWNKGVMVRSGGTSLPWFSGAPEDEHTLMPFFQEILRPLGDALGCDQPQGRCGIGSLP